LGFCLEGALREKIKGEGECECCNISLAGVNIHFIGFNGWMLMLYPYRRESIILIFHSTKIQQSSNSSKTSKVWENL
jgi:hypothetical protein